MIIDQYKVAITSTAFREMRRIYEYISEDLYAKKAAKKLIQNLEEALSKLKYMPQIYPKIEQLDDLQTNYRRIVIKNFVVLYTIDEENKIVYISHMYYGKRNYLKINEEEK